MQRAWPWRKLYFSSCRDPLEQYLSLYRYGCDGHGAFRKHQERTGSALLETYDGSQAGFEAWVIAVTGPDRLEYFPRTSALAYTPHLGLMGTRFLRLNLRRPTARLTRARDARAIARGWSWGGIPRHVIRQEHLSEDLEGLIRGGLGRHLADPASALDDLSLRPPENVSEHRDGVSVEALSEPVLAQVRALEWFHYTYLGYSAP